MSLDIFEKLLVYKESDNKSIYLVQNNIDHLLYIERHIHNDNLYVYKILQKINHPYIPRVFEIIEENDELIIIEEYINANTLESYIINNELTPDEKKHIIIELLDAIDLLHSYHIIHRDIKPENIFYDGKHIKLFDFDIARILNKDKNKDTHILGSVGYAAPEQFGFSQSDERTDIYALGVLINKILTSKFPDEQLCTNEYAHVVKKATAIDPTQRYQNITEIKCDLKKDLEFSHQSWVLPGFRTNKLKNKIIAVLGYLFVFYIVITSEYEGVEKMSVEETMNKLLLLGIFLSTIFYYCDYKGIKQYSLFHNHKNKLIRLFGQFLTLMLCWIILAIIVSLFIPTA